MSKHHDQTRADETDGSHPSKPPVRVTPSTRISVAFPFGQVRTADAVDLREAVDALSEAVGRLEAAIDRLQAGAGRP